MDFLHGAWRVFIFFVIALCLVCAFVWTIMNHPAYLFVGLGVLIFAAMSVSIGKTARLAKQLEQSRQVKKPSQQSHNTQTKRQFNVGDVVMYGGHYATVVDELEYKAASDKTPIPPPYGDSDIVLFKFDTKKFGFEYDWCRSKYLIEVDKKALQKKLKAVIKNLEWQ